MSGTPTRRRNWAMWLPLGLFLGFVALVVVGLLRPASREIRSGMIGRDLPQFDLPAIAADRPGLKTADFRQGKPRLLNIFASWCVPCAAEAPRLRRLAASGVDVYGIAIRDRPDDLAGFLARNGNPYARIGRDDVSAVQIAIGSSGVPESFVIDGQGRITYQHIGEIRDEHLPLLLEKLNEAAR